MKNLRKRSNVKYLAKKSDSERVDNLQMRRNNDGKANK